MGFEPIAPTLSLVETVALPLTTGRVSALTVTVTSRPAAATKIDSSRRDFTVWSIVLFVFVGGVWGFLGRGRRAMRPEYHARNRATARLCPIAAIFVILAISSCGGGGSSSTGGTPPPPPPPPPVTVSFTVQAVSPSLTINAGQITIQVN
jgi:hypothetical protein